MGVVKNITMAEFPKQGHWVGKRCEVCFHYNTSQKVGAEVVRDDREEPFVTILKLDDGRYVLSTECQHTPPE